MQPLILVSSNPKKLAEFKSFGLDIAMEPGRDLREVDADPVTVVRYKAKMAGDGRLVEDTSLEVDDADLGTNIRWLLETLPDHVGKRALWRVLLGANRNGNIEVYEGIMPGIIVKEDWPEDFFGFDPLFRPDGATHTLHQLSNLGLKNDFSARLQVARKLIRGETHSVTPLANLKDWTGPWQQDS